MPDILSDADIRVLVRRFYEKIQADALLAPSFAKRITDWEPHFVKMEAFWSSVVNGSGRYKGMPMPVHMRMEELEDGHFLHWLALFRETAYEVLPNAAAAQVILRAERIAGSMRMGLDFIREQAKARLDRPLRAFREFAGACFPCCRRRSQAQMTDTTEAPYWTLTPEALLARLESRVDGLTSAEAGQRLARSGPNLVSGETRVRKLRLLFRQFESPLVLVLIVGALLSLALGQWTDAAIIACIVLASALLGYQQEYKASAALLELQMRTALTAKVLRDGQAKVIPAAGIVPGDIVELTSGNLVPADGVLLDANDFLVTEAALTGESLPVEKSPGRSGVTAALAQRLNCAYSGTAVRSGMARLLVVATGRNTEMGGIARKIAGTEPDTEFARGVRQFGFLLLRVMFLMVLFVFTVSQFMGRPLVESLLYAVALAVGMTPELLPAIVSVTLAAGARAMAKQGVIVRRLEALENLGSVDILCTDKTGTLTEGAVSIAGAIDIDGMASDTVMGFSFINAAFETGIQNPLDAAILAEGQKRGLTPGTAQKVDEIPYDFQRKRLTIAVAGIADAGLHRLITKGSFKTVVSQCSEVNSKGQTAPLDDTLRARLEQQLAAYGDDGFRVLAVAIRDLPAQSSYGIADEKDMTLCGFMLFADPPKPGVSKALANLAALGIRTKMISGDNRNVAVHVARSIGMSATMVLSGTDVAVMKDEALTVNAGRADLFVEIDPQQKERIILALQKGGHVVGFLGDGINDAPALHAADVGITVDQAVDVARQSADIVLLKRDLDVLRLGVESGRKTFANTLKYISISTCSNFGNMLSMALATPFLPFLPQLAKQILLNNFLSDLPAMAISTDSVDAEQLLQVERWNIRDVQHFMVVFGTLSSVFDMITFVLLLKVFGLAERQFQTAWFIVSLLTEVAVVMSLRTRRPAWRSKPGKALIAASIVVALAGTVLPFVPDVAQLFAFVPLDSTVVSAMAGVVVAYVAVTEVAKHWFYATRRNAAVHTSQSTP
jgi:Mg2+-importing ATPase